MRRLSGILAAAYFLSAAAQAGIGDTEEQIRAHYGDPITVLPSHRQDAGLTKCYSSGGYLIGVTYLKGRSVREMLAKADNSKMTNAEIHKLLGANATDSSGNAQLMTGPRSVTAGVQEWRSVDQRSRVAIYDSGAHALFITTQQFINLTNAKNRQIAAKANIRDFVKGRPAQNLKMLNKDNARSSLRRGQSQPAATPAK